MDSMGSRAVDRAPFSASAPADILSALPAMIPKSEGITATASLQTIEPQGLQPSLYDALNAQLARNPHNPDGWRLLISIAEKTGDIKQISEVYDALIKQYPNTVCMTCVPRLVH